MWKCLSQNKSLHLQTCQGMWYLLEWVVASESLAFHAIFFSLASAFVPLTVALQWHTPRSGVAGIPLFLHTHISCDSFAATQVYFLFPLLLHSSISQQVSLCLHGAPAWLWQKPSFALRCCSLTFSSVLPLDGQLAAQSVSAAGTKSQEEYKYLLPVM